MKTPNAETVLKEMAMCTACGFCRASCPQMLDVPWEREVARGRVLLAYGLTVDELEPHPSIIDSIYTCTMCYHCVAHCPSAVPIVDIIRKIRMDMFAAGAVAEGLKEAAERLLKGENPFNTAV
ncbi:MAG: 4Fe-4S dicluster domain-containing protein, partial [Thermoplasmata archaeon]|nr:4Fe-4S dicluster domain-containing protein [Thermoplasmata archaeon]